MIQRESAEEQRTDVIVSLSCKKKRKLNPVYHKKIELME